jgi:hypothetical protein
MRTEPSITVKCDTCMATEQVGLTTTARGYDERNVDAELERMGWTVVGGNDVCPDCQEESDEEDADDE